MLQFIKNVEILQKIRWLVFIIKEKTMKVYPHRISCGEPLVLRYSKNTKMRIVSVYGSLCDCAKETPVSIRVEDIGKRALTFNPIKIYEKQF